MPPFGWTSPLGIAVALFLLAGAFHLLIGTLTPIAIHRDWTPGTLIYTGEADRAIFRLSVEELREDDAVVKLRSITLGMISGLLVGVGLLEIALAWFGLRTGQPWALGALALAGVGMIAFWIPGHALWLQAGAPGGLGALQPFQWVPTALMAPATILAWIGLR